MWNALKGESRPVGGATLAEGIAVKNVGKLTEPVVRELVSDVLLVEEAHLERAVNAFLTHQKTMAEGAGAAGLAALLANPERFDGRRVGLILCGGNIDPRILSSIMFRELERESRVVSFRLTIPDRPGVLGVIATRFGQLGANILEVEHRRLFLDVPAKGAKLDVTVETRDAEACRGDFPRAEGRRLCAGAHRRGRRDGVRALDACAYCGKPVVGRRHRGPHARLGGAVRGADAAAADRRCARGAVTIGLRRGSGGGPFDRRHGAFDDLVRIRRRGVASAAGAVSTGAAIGAGGGAGAGAADGANWSIGAPAVRDRARSGRLVRGSRAKAGGGRHCRRRLGAAVGWAAARPVPRAARLAFQPAARQRAGRAPARARSRARPAPAAPASSRAAARHRRG